MAVNYNVKAVVKSNNKIAAVGSDITTKNIESIVSKSSIKKVISKHNENKNAKQNAGFTLIELILGMVVLAIVMTIITALLAPQARQSADPVVQIRATELGQALMNEILAKSFDEKSDRSPPWTRCGDFPGSEPHCSESLGPDSESRENYDDVDDYNGLSLSGSDIENSLGNKVSYYSGFTVDISVVYDGNFDGTADAITSPMLTPSIKAKLITVKITASNNEVYGYSAYKGNY